jgi:hypothetical protein
VRHRVTEARREQIVAIERGDAERLCKLTRDGRLAGPHEAD